MHYKCLLYHPDIDAADDKNSVQEERVDPSLHTTQNTPEIKHYDHPAEKDEENGADDQKETKQEQKHKVDQSQEHDNKNEEVNDVQQQETVPDRDEAQQEGETSRDSMEPEDTEQVETFFSTMSHRYENATQEGHIL